MRPRGEEFFIFFLESSLTVSSPFILRLCIPLIGRSGSKSPATIHGWPGAASVDNAQSTQRPLVCNVAFFRRAAPSTSTSMSTLTTTVVVLQSLRWPIV